MSLSAEQLTDFRADLGDQTVPYAFSDAELDRLYARSSNDWNAALLLAVNQLLRNAAKLYNYAAGYTRQDEASVFDHLVKVRELLLADTNGAFIVGTASVPTKNKEEPSA